jgi:hypothetical protein
VLALGALPPKQDGPPRAQTSVVLDPTRPAHDLAYDATTAIWVRLSGSMAAREGAQA